MNHWKQSTTPPKSPSLRFSPTAWAKLLFLRDAGNTEIGGFGVTAPGDLLLVEDLVLVTQICTSVTIEFDDESVADFFDAQVAAGRHPEEFARVWIHTHPGNSAQPSIIDEATFPRVFGRADWAVMCILARGGQTYARLRFNIGPGGDVLIPIEVDFSQPFAGSDFERWHEEYLQNVRKPVFKPMVSKTAKCPSGAVARESAQEDWWDYGQPPADWYEDWHEYTKLDDLEQESETLGYIRDF
jgi:hypothetical protein